MEWVGGRDARRLAVKGLLPLTVHIPSRGCCAIRNSRDDLPGHLEGQWQRRWMPWRCGDGRRTTYEDAADGVRHYPQRRVNRQALLRRWEANDAAPLRRQLLRHCEPDAARGEEARRACATWPGPPGSNQTQQSNLGRRGGRGEILMHATIKLRTAWRTWRDTAAIAPREVASASRKARAGGDTPAPRVTLSA
jgi:hypothetical protein